MAKKKIKFSEQGLKKLATAFNYKGDISKFKDFLASDPAKQHLVNSSVKKFLKAAQGGMVGYSTGGMTQEQAKAKLKQIGPTVSGSGGDYSDLSSFDNYNFSSSPYTLDEFKAVAKAAGAGEKSQAASDINVAHGAGGNAYQHTAAASTPATTTASTTTTATPTVNPVEKQMQDIATNPQLTANQTVTPTKIAYDSATQDIASGTGQLTGDDPKGTVSTATKADDVVSPTAKTAETYTADKSEDDVKKITDDLEAKTLDKDKIQKVTAQEQTKSSVSDLEAEQGEGILMDDLKKRQLQEGELVEGVADAKKGAAFTEEIKAAQGEVSDKSTMRYQMSEYMKDFEDGGVPQWAAGAMKSVINQMAAQGISGSNATQAAMQAMLEKSIDLASVDAGTFAKMDAMNLSNRQQRAMLAAEQRAKFMGQEFDQKFQSRVINASKVSDIANMNFTAEQTIALENSKIANTMNLANLNNKQALVMAEAAALSNLDIANLNNRQQAQVENAKNFLAVDMANLANEQQTSMFKSQASINSILSDQAASNAEKQFNATSKNQVNQFYDQLTTQVKQFNNAQENAIGQFNAGQKNSMSQFNAQIQNQRDQFNAQNQLVIAQSNVQWRRAIATGDTAAINRANELNAQSSLQMSQMAYQQIWQQYGDSMERAWTSSENELNRLTTLATTKMQVEGQMQMAEDQRNADSIAAVGGLLMDFIF